MSEALRATDGQRAHSNSSPATQHPAGVALAGPQSARSCCDGDRRDRYPGGRQIDRLGPRGPYPHRAWPAQRPGHRHARWPGLETSLAGRPDHYVLGSRIEGREPGRAVPPDGSGRKGTTVIALVRPFNRKRWAARGGQFPHIWRGPRWFRPAGRPVLLGLESRGADPACQVP
jgi:hypothetical protein